VQWLYSFHALLMGTSAAEAGNVKTFRQIRDQVIDYFANPETWINFSMILVKVLIIFIVGRIIVKVVNKAINHMIIDKETHPLKFDQRRTRTIARLTSNVISYTINFITILMILNQFGFELAPLLAGAGVVGLAVGFGAQSLVKDVITGFFIIFEDQFAVGDIIQTGNFKGNVEEIGLRVTRIKSWTGEVHIIPNGSITEVTNYSLNNSIAVVDVSIAYEADIDTAIKVIKSTVSDVYASNEDIVKEPDVLGVQTLAASEVVIRVTSECKPNTHFGVARELNAQIKKSLDAHGIEIPYPRLVTYHRSERGEA
jgi:small-conductance mechanosensitive channel